MLNVTLGPTQQHDRLTLFPLVARDAPKLPFALMAEALDLGTLRITEVDSGVVGELLAINSGSVPILVLDGEQLIGAKQNRTTNRSMLLAASSETRLPVSCMEQGRWHHDSTHFSPARHNSPSDVRRKAREVEARHVEMAGEAPPEVLADAQMDVWAAIHGKFEQMGAASATSAMDQIYTQRETDLTTLAASFPAVDGQVGLLAFVGGRPLGMDVIGCRTLYAKLHGRLLTGYLMDALSSRGAASAPAAGAAQQFLDSVSAAKRVPSTTAGIGSYAVLTGQVIGGELSAEEGVVHLSAFPTRDTRGGGGDGGGVIYDAPISPPSRRRR